VPVISKAASATDKEGAGDTSASVATDLAPRIGFAACGKRCHFRAMDDIESIARVIAISKACHAAYVAYCSVSGISVPVPWDELPEEEQKRIIRKVEYTLREPEAPVISHADMVYFGVIHALRPTPEEPFSITALHMPR